jgi:glutamine phosphoribosylpyrophosphate amidotransferase
VDTPTKRELIAANNNVEGIRRFVESVISFQPSAFG